VFSFRAVLIIICFPARVPSNVSILIIRCLGEAIGVTLHYLFSSAQLIADQRERYIYIVHHVIFGVKVAMLSLKASSIPEDISKKEATCGISGVVRGYVYCA
jgi:hypothetical protein